MDYFISDLHLDHRNIMKYCGRQGLSDEERQLYLARKNFRVSDDSIRRMNEIIISDINFAVSKKDVLWILGDFYLPDRDTRKNLPKFLDGLIYWRNRIDCNNVYLIWGNHDIRSWAQHNARKSAIEQRKIFSGIYDLKTICIYEQCIVLCHYALATWEQMNCKWGPPFWNLYGHSHGTAEAGLDASLPGRKSMDVGIDNIYRLFGNYRPLSFYQIKDIMDSKPGHKIDHHAKVKNEKWLGKDHSFPEEDA